MDWAKTTARWDETHSSFGIWCMHLLIEIWQYWHNANKQTHVTTRKSPGCHHPIRTTQSQQPITEQHRVTHICVSKLTIIGSDKWLVAWPAPSHYLNQCRYIVNWTLGNKLQWNLNRNANIFIQENAFETVVRKMAAILSRPQCVNHTPLDNNPGHRLAHYNLVNPPGSPPT